MQDLIENMKNEKFIYERSTLLFSEEQILLHMEPDSTAEGTLLLRTADGRRVNGNFYSSHPRMKCLQPEFQGAAAELRYRFDSTGMRSGETALGNFQIVSEAGEYEIPFAVTAEFRVVTTSEGKLRTVADFVTLANLDSEMAYQAFSHPNFIQTLKNDNPKYLRWYEGFVRGGITFEAMMAFLRVTGMYHEPVKKNSLRAELKRAYNRQNINYEKRTYQRSIIRLGELYLQFRGMKLSPEEWGARTGEILAGLVEGDRNTDFFRLLTVHKSLLAGDEAGAKDELNQYVDSHYDLQKNAELYGYYLYLCAMLRRSAAFLVQACQRVRVLYARKPGSVLLLWVLLMMDEDLLKNPLEKLKLMEEQYRSGVHSPFIYIEALMLYKQDPLLIQELSEYELQILFLGQRYELVSPEMMKRIAGLSMHLREFSPKVFRLLADCYRQYPDRTTVHAVCSLLMKGNKTDERYFVWYARGVEMDLRITRLYDFFLYSVKENMDEPLSEQVLQYLRYNQDIDYRKKAFLYANLYKFRSHYPELFEQYHQDMLDFTVYQLGKGRFNRHLILLYQNLVNRRFVGPRTAYPIIDAIFSYWIEQTPGDTVAVVVREPAFAAERVIPVTDGEVVVSVYSTDACVYYQNKEGVRTGIPDIYEKNRWFPKEELLELCEQYCPEHPGILLGRGERLVQNPQENWQRELLLLSQETVLSEEYRQEIWQQLMQHYYDQYELDPLAWCLDQIDILKLPARYRSYDIELLIMQGDYAQAGEYVYTYGFEKINPKLLVRLCSRLICREEFAWNESLLRVCCKVFEMEKYDEVMLTYLLEFAEGDTRFLCRLWSAGQKFGLDTFLLEERILKQALRSGFFRSTLYEVFDSYQKHGGSSDLITAFLTCLSKDLIMKELQPDVRLFHWLSKELLHGEELNGTCRLAWLYGLCGQENPEGEARELAGLILGEWTRKGSYFSFFCKLPPALARPEFFEEKTYIEYRTKPSVRVFCYYREPGADAEDSFCVEELNAAYPGVYVKECTLFTGETLEYDLVEQENGESRLVKSGRITKTQPAQIKGSRYQRMDALLAAKGTRQEELLEQYLQEHAHAKLFHRHEL